MNPDKTNSKMKTNGEKPLQHSNRLRHSISALLLMSSSALIANEAFAQSAYNTKLGTNELVLGAGTGNVGGVAINCGTCHVSNSTPGPRVNAAAVLSWQPKVGSTGAETWASCVSAFEADSTHSTAAYSAAVYTTVRTCIDAIPLAIATPTPAPATPTPAPNNYVPMTYHTSTLGKVGKAIGATDLYQVTCTTGTNNIIAQVSDLPPIKSTLVSTQIFATRKGQRYSSLLSTDTVDGDGIYSPMTIIANRGNGIYTIAVNKSPGFATACEASTNDDDNNLSSDHSCIATPAVLGPELYTVRFACRNILNVNIPGTTWQLIQDN